MHIPGYYSSGEFAKLAHVSLRTIRYYDQKNILKPSYVNPQGARFYTDDDFVRLQQILLLKYLGFSLSEINEMLVAERDYHFLLSSLNIQKKLVQERIAQLQLIENAIDNTTDTIKSNQEIDWQNMLELIHLTGMENSLKKQYQDANNISARINLHQNYSTNPQGWFPWIYEQLELQDGMSVLEVGCGNGALWLENMSKLQSHHNLFLTLSDVSEGMLRDAKRNIGSDNALFHYQAFDCHKIPYPDESFDLVIANHVLFYCHDITAVCKEVSRILKPNGKFICSTYGTRHMQEITQLVQQFDRHIVLSGEVLYEKFGLENGANLLNPFFASVQKLLYKDEIIISDAEPLIEYILSCHGNQNKHLMDRYADFRSFIEKKLQKPFHITKEAGIFVSKKIQ